MKRTFCLILCTIVCCTLAVSQTRIEKSFPTSNRKLGGDAVITKSIQEVKETKAFTTFEVEVPSAGNYYANFWLCPAESPNGFFYEYEVIVNEKMVGKIVPTHGDWQSISINDRKSIELPAGKSTISVVGTIPDLPSVEFVRLSKDQESAQIDDSAYKNYKNEVRRISEARLNQTASTDSQIGDTIAITRDITFPFPSQNNPPYDALFVIGASVYYTFYTCVYFNVGAVTISTEGLNNFSHVLEVFSASNPASYTWRNLSNSLYKASLNITIPFSGYYYVKIRSYYNTTSGLCNLNINNQYLYNGVTVYSYGKRGEKDTNNIYNSFTCYCSGDPRLWVEEGNTPGYVTAYNDNYSDCTDFNWGNNARVLRQYSDNLNAIHLTSASSYNPVSYCDIYLNCLSSSLNTSSTNFIQSAPFSSNYNCISWSGGIYSAPIWPPSDFSSTISDPLAAFDYFYGTERYPGSSIFTRTGATASNCSVELWAGVISHKYTHASVKKGADNNAHGFDWESKCGYNPRVYHPEGIILSTYGEVVEYYRRISNNTSGNSSLEEAIANGDAVMENVQFTPDENNYLETRISALAENEKSRFEILFDKWSLVWNNSFYSNPDQIADCDEYRELLSFCKTNENLKFAVFKRLGEGNYCATCLVKDLTLEKNKAILRKILEEKERCKKTEDGKFIFYTMLSNAMSYVKELMAGEILSHDKTRNAGKTTGVSYSNAESFDICVTNDNLNISFLLCDTSRVSLDIIDLEGKTVAVLVNQPSMDAKTYNYQCTLPKGVYLVRFVLNGTVNVKKVSIR